MTWALLAAALLTKAPAVGDTVTVPVTSVADYGCFVRGSGWEGLVHVTDLSWAKVRGASAFCVKGQQLTLQVLRVNDGRVALSRKALLQDPWGLATQRYEAGQKLRVRVAAVLEDGAAVELEPGVDGLIPLAEFGRGPFPHGGDFVDAKVVTMDRDSRAVRLTYLPRRGDAKAGVALAMKDVGEASAKFNGQADALLPVVKKKLTPGEDAEALDWQATAVHEALVRLGAADGLTEAEQATIRKAKELFAEGPLPVEAKRLAALQAALRDVVALFHVLELRFVPAEERRPPSRGRAAD